MPDLKIHNGMFSRLHNLSQGLLLLMLARCYPRPLEHGTVGNERQVECDVCPLVLVCRLFVHEHVVALSVASERSTIKAAL